MVGVARGETSGPDRRFGLGGNVRSVVLFAPSICLTVDGRFDRSGWCFRKISAAPPCPEWHVRTDRGGLSHQAIGDGWKHWHIGSMLRRHRYELAPVFQEIKPAWDQFESITIRMSHKVSWHQYSPVYRQIDLDWSRQLETW